MILPVFSNTALAIYGGVMRWGHIGMVCSGQLDSDRNDKTRPYWPITGHYIQAELIFSVWSSIATPIVIICTLCCSFICCKDKVETKIKALKV